MLHFEFILHAAFMMTFRDLIKYLYFLIIKNYTFYITILKINYSDGKNIYTFTNTLAQNMFS